MNPGRRFTSESGKAARERRAELERGEPRTCLRCGAASEQNLLCADCERRRGPDDPDLRSMQATLGALGLVRSTD